MSLNPKGGVPFHRAWPLTETKVRDFLFSYSTHKKCSARHGAAGLIEGQELHKVLFSLVHRALFMTWVGVSVGQPSHTTVL